MTPEPLVSCVLCYYNEEAWIDRTIASLAAQTDRRFELVLVDNGSTDDSVAVARRAAAAMPDISIQWLEELSPGKLFALQTGIAATRCDWFTTMDADTIYPPEYVQRCIALAKGRGAVCVMAFAGKPDNWPARIKLSVFARLFPSKSHTGGCGQTFHKPAFHSTGGFDKSRWPFVLEDHEIIHRMARHGRLIYDNDHYCTPSDRRTDRTNCSWTFGERILYKIMPVFLMDWFFYRFLARRLESRGLDNIRLREQAWQDIKG